jgi:hypothetical protein
MGYSGSSGSDPVFAQKKLEAHLGIKKIMLLLVKQRSVNMAPLMFE